MSGESISDATYYNWKKHGNFDLSKLRLLKQLKEENRQLKKLVSDLSLDIQMLHKYSRKKVLKQAQRRNLAVRLQQAYRIS